jgi:hypothetical protein
VIDLTLRHLWTSTGAPITWRVTGNDEDELSELLKRMHEWKAEPESRAAVLVAVEEDGTLIGAWNREGTAQLVQMIDMVPRSNDLLQIRHALMHGVTGP